MDGSSDGVCDGDEEMDGMSDGVCDGETETDGILDGVWVGEMETDGIVEGDADLAFLSLFPAANSPALMMTSTFSGRVVSMDQSSFPLMVLIPCSSSWA